MRQGNNPRRSRGRSGRRPNVHPRSQTFDSNGPEGRIRGNATQVYEKYLALARDAQVSGDRIHAEALQQFAEHYYRLLNDSTDPQRQRPESRETAPQDGQDERPDSQADQASEPAGGERVGGERGGGEAVASEPPSDGEDQAAGEGAGDSGDDGARGAPRSRRGTGRRRRGAEAAEAPETADAGLLKMLGESPRQANGEAGGAAESASTPDTASDTASDAASDTVASEAAPAAEDKPAPKPRRRRRRSADEDKADTGNGNDTSDSEAASA